jgi:hypothetical protein
MFYLASRAFAFGGIKHPELNPFLFWGPIISASALTFIFWLMPIQPKLTGDGSLSRHMITVFAILPGFFIAALSAVATFNRAEMDEIMPFPAPKIKLRTGAEESYVEMTSRMFTSHLFSYLTTISFIAVFVFVAADISAATAVFLINKISNVQFQIYTKNFISLFYVWVLVWLSSKIILTTLVGLYFMSERIHRPHS